jgi:hypothetical protein
MTWLAPFAASISETAREKGFDPPSWDNYIAKLGLIYTEIDETVDAMKSDESPIQDIAAELADIGIRSLDVLHTLGPGIWCPGRFENRQVCRPAHGRVFVAPEVLVQPIRNYVARSIEHRRHEQRTDAIVALELALLETMRVAERCGIPLFAAMAKKAEFNKGRPHLNGKKHASG